MLSEAVAETATAVPETVVPFRGVEMDTEGAVVSPVEVVPPTPVSETTGAVTAALLNIVRVPVRVPETVGVNFTLAVQLAPGARLEAQVPVPPKV
jgi:hypothetical protein